MDPSRGQRESDPSEGPSGDCPTDDHQDDLKQEACHVEQASRQLQRMSVSPTKARPSRPLPISPILPSLSPILPSSTPILPSSTPILPSDARILGSLSPILPSSTPILPSSTPFLPSSKPFLPSSTPILPYSKPFLPSSTPNLPSSKPFLPSSTPILPSSKPFLPSSTPILPASKPFLPSSTPIVPSSTPILPSDVRILGSLSPILPSSTPIVPSSPTILPPLSPITCDSPSPVLFERELDGDSDDAYSYPPPPPPPPPSGATDDDPVPANPPQIAPIQVLEDSLIEISDNTDDGLDAGAAEEPGPPDDAPTTQSSPPGVEVDLVEPQPCEQFDEELIRSLAEYKQFPKIKWSKSYVEFLMNILDDIKEGRYSNKSDNIQSLDVLFAEMVTKYGEDVSTSSGLLLSKCSPILHLLNQIFLNYIMEKGYKNCRCVRMFTENPGYCLVQCLLYLKTNMMCGRYVLSFNELTLKKVKKLIDVKSIVVTYEKLQSIFCTIQGNISCLVTSSDDAEAWKRLSDIGKMCKKYRIPHIITINNGHHMKKILEDLQKMSYDLNEADIIIASAKHVFLSYDKCIMFSEDKTLITRIYLSLPVLDDHNISKKTLQKILSIGEVGYEIYNRNIEQQIDLVYNEIKSIFALTKKVSVVKQDNGNILIKNFWRIKHFQVQTRMSNNIIILNKHDVLVKLYIAQSIAFIQEIVNEIDAFVHKMMNKEYIVIPDRSPPNKQPSASIGGASVPDKQGVGGAGEAVEPTTNPEVPSSLIVVSDS